MLTAFALYDCLKEFGDPIIFEMMILKRICEKQECEGMGRSGQPQDRYCKRGIFNTSYTR
jgi:hypothetical protein